MRISFRLIAMAALELLALAAVATAAPSRAAPARPAAAPPLPWIENDWPKALAIARARQLPIFVENWAPW